MPKYFSSCGLIKYQKKIKKLEEELTNLESQVQNTIEVGGNQWHDNASYELLVQDIAVVNRRLEDAYRDIQGARIIEYPTSVESVVCGCEVDFLFDGHQDSFKIVAYGDGDIDNNKIVYEAQIAKVMIGKRKRDKFEAEINDQRKNIEILDIKPLNN